MDKRKTWLWVLGWICFCPIPLTILMLRKERITWAWVLGWIIIFPIPVTIIVLRKMKNKPVLKYSLVAAIWMIYLMTGGILGSFAPTVEVVNDSVKESTEAEISDSTLNTENKTGENNVKVTEKTLQDEASIYSKLSDHDFGILTSLMAQSFYSFSTEGKEFQVLEENKGIKDCLHTLFDYADTHGFEIDPEYKKVYATKYSVVEKIENYDLLEKNFFVGQTYNPEKKDWEATIESYSVNMDDVVEYDGIKYIDPEGYLAAGVRIYWIDDGMCEIGEVKEIAYNKEINGVIYPYGINVEFFDDPEDSGWRDGDSFLRTKKKIDGKPAYYIRLLDKNRLIQKEEIDYEGNITWTPINIAKDLIGKDVYIESVAGSAKAYCFKVVSVDKENDIMIVKYPNGNNEEKSYSAMMNKGTLFIK